jgi:hypothetical protein
MLTAFIGEIVSDACKRRRKTGAPVVEAIVNGKWKNQ